MTRGPAATTNGSVVIHLISQGGTSYVRLYAVKGTYPQQEYAKLAAPMCRVNFAHDIEMEKLKLQTDIDRMQRQLEVFDNNTAVTSSYSQKHAVETDSFAGQVTTRVQDSTPDRAPSLPRPFLFVGVLSVAANAGTTSHDTCMASAHQQLHLASVTALCTSLHEAP